MRYANFYKFLWRIHANIRVSFFAAAILLAPFVLAGCVGFGIGRTAQVGKGGEFVKGSVVKGFPSVPVYPKAEVVETYGDGSNWGASLVSKDSLGKVLKFYQEGLPKTGWESGVEQSLANRYVFTIKNTNYTGRLIINTAADNKKTAITVSLFAR